MNLALAAKHSTPVVVAIISLVGVLFTGGIAAATQIYLRRNVGKTNGSGSLATMVEHTLETQGALGRDVAELKRTGQVLRRDLALTKNTVDQHDATDSLRFDRIEQMLRTQKVVRDERTE